MAEEPASAAAQSEVDLGPANLTGRVIEAGTKKPLVAVEVTSKATGESAFTDDKGYFELHGVPAGTTEVTASSLDYQTEVFSVAIDEGKATDIEVFLTRENYSEYELTVRGQRVVNEVTQRVLSNREIQKVAGTQGDTLKVIEALPGVARTPGGLGGLVLLRGTDQFASSVFVDNIPLPRLFHFGGLRSVMNSELVEKLQFYPGNAAVKYGQSTGGSIDIITKNPRTDQFYGKVNLNVYEGGFLLGGPITEKVSVVGAFHRSWYDAVLPLVLPAGSSTNLTVAPRYYDYQLKVNWAAKPGARSLLG
jgi:outer membrane receptor protein involved in Fe transport